MNNKKKNTLNKLMGDCGSSMLQNMNTKLLVTNFPCQHSKENILKICEVFGKVKSVDLLKDPVTGEFRGHVHVEYIDEVEAKKGHTGMMGLKVGDGALLYVKRLTTLATPLAGLDGEMFKALLDDLPTPCLILRNLFVKEDIDTREDYKELEASVEEEMQRYGTCLKVYCPRPPMFGEADSVSGFGKVFVRFSHELEAEKAKQGIYRRRCNGRAVDTIYYPLEKFLKN
jgi:splicing factor U2AF 65 kDa subunit